MAGRRLTAPQRSHPPRNHHAHHPEPIGSAMTARKFLAGAALVLFAFYVVQNPIGAAGLVRTVALGAARFATALTGGA